MPASDMKGVDEAVVEHLVNQIRPILRGYPAEIQGAVCANLIALWIAGHRDADNPRAPGPAEFREQLLTDAIDFIRDLIPFEDEWITQHLIGKR